MYLMPAGTSTVNNRKWNLGRLSLQPVHLRGLGASRIQRRLRGLAQDDGTDLTVVSPDVMGPLAPGEIYAPIAAPSSTGIDTTMAPVTGSIMMNPTEAAAVAYNPNTAGAVLTPTQITADSIAATQAANPGMTPAQAAAAVQAAANPSLISQVAASVAGGLKNVGAALSTPNTPLFSSSTFSPSTLLVLGIGLVGVSLLSGKKKRRR
jgi:hypothetical protein